jgi:hypothetical protein
MLRFSTNMIGLHYCSAAKTQSLFATSADESRDCAEKPRYWMDKSGFSAGCKPTSEAQTRQSAGRLTPSGSGCVGLSV